jgi:hypothetical protein
MHATGSKAANRFSRFPGRTQEKFTAENTKAGNAISGIESADCVAGLRAFIR